MNQPHAFRKSVRVRELLEICFETFCKSGLENTGIKRLADACGVGNSNLIYYFQSKDNLVVEATAHCMMQVVEDLLDRFPTGPSDVERCLTEIPHLAAERYGEKLRFMYQVYTSPQYRSSGQAFFQQVKEYCRNRVKKLALQLRLPEDLAFGLFGIVSCAVVHYAMFEDEEFLNLQLQAIRVSLSTLGVMALATDASATLYVSGTPVSGSCT